MLLFSLALHPVLLQLAASFIDLRLVAAYADDVNILQPGPRVAAVLEFLRIEGLPRVFTIKMVKTEAWWWGRELSPLPCSVN